jgi:hyperosmotically inducible protein
MKRLVSATIACALVLSTVAAPAFATGRSVGEKVDDAVITTTVKTKLTTDRPKNLVKVNVDTKDGVVHLKGTVSTPEAREEAERLARATKGVRDVVNDLQVEGSPSAAPKQ